MGEFLKELHLTEGRNTGIHKMLRSLAENGSPKPVLETDEDRLYFLVTIYARSSVDYRPPRESKETTRMTQRREKILAYLSDYPQATIPMASSELRVGVSTLNRDIAELKKEGRLRREGPNKGGRWVVP